MSVLRRLRPLDRAVLLVVFPIWLVLFSLHVVRWVTVGIAEPGVFVTARSECPGHPLVRSLRPSSLAESSGLRPGDEVLRIGERDLDCAGPVQFFVYALEAMSEAQSAPIVYRREGATHESLLQFTPMPFPLRFVVVSAGFALTGLLLVLRAPRSRSATTLFAGWLLLSFGYLRPWGGPPARTEAVLVTLAVISAFSIPAVLRAAVAFPDDAMSHGRWTRWFPWLFAPVGVLYLNAIVGIPLFPGDANLSKPLSELLLMVVSVLVAGFITSNYVRCDPLGRRQIRWAVAGIYLQSVPIVTATAISIADHQYWWLSDSSEILLIVVPVFVLIATFRYNLFDIDRLISATASYLFLSGAMILIGVNLLPTLSSFANAMLGTDHNGQYVAATFLAAAVIGGNRLVQPLVERRLFPHRCGVADAIDELLAALPALRTPGELGVRAAGRLDEIFHPQSTAIYVRREKDFEAVFARGPTVPPCLAASHPVVAALQDRVEPLVAEKWGRRLDRSLDPFDVAVLQTLDAALLFPVSLNAQLVAFLSLGPKRSGDVYTNTEVDLIRSVVASVALQLERFGQNAMREALQRYVPGAVAGAISAGKDLEASVQEVAVMFVDIRGYTNYAEGREASEIFSTVSRYTELVSGIVSRHEGSIVEFNGDGLMAVFGAPQAIAAKEASAVRAGLEILQSLDAVPLVAEGTAHRISVGVGIATGDAYVGNIRAVDRLIWSAIGNTTNLASRLQGLTRTLDAAMAIDATTADRIGDLRALLQQESNVRVAGRSELFDVWVLRRTPGSR